MHRRTAVPTVVEEVVDPRREGFRSLQLYLRLPPGAEDGSKLDGVIAYCTWESNRERIMQQLLYDTNRPDGHKNITALQMLKYASDHNLAVLTWTTPGRWNAAKSFGEVDREAAKKADEQFDEYSEMWERGVKDFVRKYKIPESDYLLYGISRGAQWAHRLALRRPKYFWAINIHVNSSYDEPTPEASECLWLVTTGDLEHGYSAAQNFYRKCRKLNYPILFKAQEKLGHSSCVEVEWLRDRFFDFALKKLAERRKLNLKKADMAERIHRELPKSQFIGDFLNQDVVERDYVSLIPENLRVYLPSEPIAEAWELKYDPDRLKK